MSTIQSRKAKGREHQKAIAKIMTEAINAEEGDIVSRPMGSQGCDLILSPFARRKLHLAPECKASRAFPGMPALEQARANTPEGDTPCVVWKPPGKNSTKSIIYFDINEYFEWREKEIELLEKEIKERMKGTNEKKD